MVTSAGEGLRGYRCRQGERREEGAGRNIVQFIQVQLPSGIEKKYIFPLHNDYVQKSGERFEFCTKSLCKRYYIQNVSELPESEF